MVIRNVQISFHLALPRDGSVLTQQNEFSGVDELVRRSFAAHWPLHHGLASIAPTEKCVSREKVRHPLLNCSPRGTVSNITPEPR